MAQLVTELEEDVKAGKGQLGELTKQVSMKLDSILSGAEPFASD